MTFSDFAHRIGGVLRGADSQSAFAKTLFEMIIPDDRDDLLEDISESTWKSYFNGGARITRLAKKINAVADPMLFESYINEQDDPAVQKLCDAFIDVLPEINLHNASEQIAGLFNEIINEAAGGKKEKPASSKQENYEDDSLQLAFLTRNDQVVPDLSGMDGVFILGDRVPGEKIEPFETYLQKAIEHYSVKPTLINREQPQQFYDIYVCADLVRNAAYIAGTTAPDKDRRIKEATLAKLKKVSKHIVIEGTGGIGKSMFLTHLFLTSAQQHKDGNGRVPVFVTLKDYNENTSGFMELVWQSIRTFDPMVELKDVIQSCDENNIDLLLDGLDEIPTTLRESFYKDMEAFIKCYPGIVIVLSSRPVHTPFPYGRFSTYEIEELSLDQASELIRKIHFWDEVSKAKFLQALKTGLYYSHRQFASNPLLLTIMLMTYAYFGTSFDDMHVFYAKAYETMARLHDQTKGSYQRPLHTKLSPEDFAVFFSQFCARTYTAEVFEFTELTFATYMNKVIKKVAPSNSDLSPRDFALDLTDNLCLMYHEGEKYYFIHRSFQEYFAAVYFATDFETKLESVGNFFEKLHHRSYSDHTFDMLYGMIPQKVERNIFLPYLKSLISECASETEENAEEEDRPQAEYWAFLERQYPFLYYEQGEVGESNINSPESFIYSKIREKKNLHYLMDFDNLPWPSEIYALPTKKWVSAYRNFLKEEAFDRYPDPERIPDELLDYEDIVEEDRLPYRYADYFGKPELKGATVEIEIFVLQQNPEKHREMREFMELDGFPLVEEYKFMKAYCAELENEKQREAAAHDLFDD